MHQTNVKARTSKRQSVNDYMFSLSCWFSKDFIQIVCRADEIYMYILVRVLNPPLHDRLGLFRREITDNARAPTNGIFP